MNLAKTDSITHVEPLEKRALQAMTISKDRAITWDSAVEVVPCKILLLMVEGASGSRSSVFTLQNLLKVTRADLCCQMRALAAVSDRGKWWVLERPQQQLKQVVWEKRRVISDWLLCG